MGNSVSKMTDIYDDTPVLLHAYTYFINETCSSYVTVGFSAEDYMPIVGIGAACTIPGGTQIIIFNTDSWELLCKNGKKIIDLLEKHEYSMEALKMFNVFENYMEIDFLYNPNLIEFAQHTSCVQLSKKEFHNLMKLFDFISSTLIYNNSIKHFVKNYCEKYVKGKLDSSSEFNCSVNYFRLFSELKFYDDKINNVKPSEK